MKTPSHRQMPEEHFGKMIVSQLELEATTAV